MKVLIIDDSRAMRMILSKIMTDIGCEVREASDGASALSQLQQDKPALALVDWNMPGISGLEFVEKVRALPEYDSVLLMMVTTETEMDHVSTALSAGANEYVMKPFTEEIILNKLALLGLNVTKN